MARFCLRNLVFVLECDPAAGAINSIIQVVVDCPELSEVAFAARTA